MLAFDTSSRRTWVGLKLEPSKLVAESEEQDPSKTLFRLVEKLFGETGISLADLRSIIFCAGPGSMLGARTASMAIRAWKGIGIAAAQNVFTYNSLQIGALIANASPDAPPCGLIITDARRSSWNTLPYPQSRDDSIELIPNESLETETHSLVSFAEFPRWTKTAAKLIELAYDPTPVFEGETFLSLIEPTDEATPLIIRSNEYKKWDAKIHTASRE
ncbi:hypothetical protein VDG1235_4580 [Verrucomicrobiia bacterium DG1235]|nr:hypothetical protein VDG1235_4580 [Verrucomicrobiae bacterium DG1235]